VLRRVRRRKFFVVENQRVRFGLGQIAAVEQIEIHWPSGAVERLNLASTDRFYPVEEGKGIVPSIYDQSRRNPRE
jgi:enediyne biosynthesis protein E4